VRIYRLYFLDRESDVLKAVELACDDDKAAVEAADQHDDPCARKELWQSARLVQAWPQA
jgi:hypothetical protein